MNYYAASLNGLKQILHASGEIPYEKYIDDCIREWEERHSAEKLEAAFKKGGIFENFVFQRSDFNTDEDVQRSHQYLESIGITRIDEFTYERR